MPISRRQNTRAHLATFDSRSRGRNSDWRRHSYAKAGLDPLGVPRPSDEQTVRDILGFRFSVVVAARERASDRNDLVFPDHVCYHARLSSYIFGRGRGREFLRIRLKRRDLARVIGRYRYCVIDTRRLKFAQCPAAARVPGLLSVSRRECIVVLSGERGDRANPQAGGGGRRGRGAWTSSKHVNSVKSRGGRVCPA